MLVFVLFIAILAVWAIISKMFEVNKNYNIIDKQLNYITNHNNTYISNYESNNSNNNINTSTLPKMVNFIQLLNITDTTGYTLPWIIGIDESGNIIVKDISKSPHLLIAGATGSGKSVALNTLIISLLLKGDINNFEFVMIDPKIIELNYYSNLPNLKCEIITDIDNTIKILNNLIIEMNNRYRLLADHKVKSIDMLKKKTSINLKRIVVCFDEFADFSLQDKTIHEKVTLLVQKSRAAGIHLVIATQKPIKQVIDTKIKANITECVALKTTNYTESNLIIGCKGAETLKGNGEMLIKDNNGLTKCKGAFIEDSDIERICSNL